VHKGGLTVNDIRKQLNLFDMDVPFPGYADGADVILWVKAKAKAPKPAVQGVFTDSKGNVYLKLAVTEPPENNKANGAFLELIASLFNVPSARVNLVSGQASGFKKFRIANYDFTKACEVLKKHI
jgi:uncharacterized protein YggU (UPF0235/DUF167 family)